MGWFLERAFSILSSCPWNSVPESSRALSKSSAFSSSQNANLEFNRKNALRTLMQQTSYVIMPKKNMTWRVSSDKCLVLISIIKARSGSSSKKSSLLTKILSSNTVNPDGNISNAIIFCFQVWFGLYCLKTPDLSKDIRCHV